MRLATSASTSVSAWVGESGPTSASPMAPTRAVAVKAGSWGGSSPRATPSAMVEGEGVGVGAAKLQALSLDGGVDGFGQQRPCQPPALQRAAGERVDGGDQPLPRGLPTPLGRRHRPHAARRPGRPRSGGRPSTGSGGRPCQWPHPRAWRPRRPAPRGSRRGRRAPARRARSSRACLRAAGLGALGGAVGHGSSRSEPWFTTWGQGAWALIVLEPVNGTSCGGPRIVPGGALSCTTMSEAGR